jgi:hypothetical protein
MTKDEFSDIGTALAEGIGERFCQTGKRIGLGALDVVMIVICFCALNTSLDLLTYVFDVSASSISRMVRETISKLASVARRLWLPRSVGEEAGRSVFSKFPNCVAAVDTTPIRVLDGRKKFKQKALFSRKYACACWKLLCAVTASGICIWFAPLAPGRRHDKRILDESDAARWFRYVVRTADRWIYRRHAILTDRGFQGLSHYWPEAMVKPMGQPQTPMDRDYFADHDTSRVIVEQWSGRIKEVFQILGDHAYRGDMDLLDDIVTFCICVYNQLVRLRGYPGYTPPDVTSTVPDSASVPPGVAVHPAAAPKVHPADQLTGVTTVNFKEISRTRQWNGPFPNDATPLP